MAIYSFAGRRMRKDESGFDAFIASAYGVLPRPLCMCRSNGVEMYVAKAGERHVIKRMPDSGSVHHLSCESYEPPPELSGIGELTGAAIRTNVGDGTTLLKFGFPMSRQRTRGPTETTGGGDANQPRGGARLTLRAALHFLWAEAGFNKWFPSMAGKRSWFVIRKFLMEAAGDKLVKGRWLCEMLYVPEPFEIKSKAAIATRRSALFNRIVDPEKPASRFLLLIGEVKEISAARYGKRLTIRHAPDCPFMLRDDLARQTEAQFSAELEMWGAIDAVRLVVMGTFSVGANGVASMEALTLMPTTDQWIPVESGAEKVLADRLVHEGRRFEKGLRYNLTDGAPLACAVLLDTAAPVAIYIAPPIRNGNPARRGKS